VSNPPLASRSRSKRTFLDHKAQYEAQLDRIAAAGQGDPSQLCNETYSSVTACARAVAADKTALREQVFPVYRCGRTISGELITTRDATAVTPGNDHQANTLIVMGMSFTATAQYYTDRLKRENALLETARHPH